MKQQLTDLIAYIQHDIDNKIVPDLTTLEFIVKKLTDAIEENDDEKTKITGGDYHRLAQLIKQANDEYEKAQNRKKVDPNFHFQAEI